MNVPMAHPFGLTSVGAIYQRAIQHHFTDQIKGDYINDLPEPDLPKADHAMTTVNMVYICLLYEKSLQTILEESPRTDSKDSAKTAINHSTPLRRHLGELFMVNHDSITRNGETDSQCGACEARNTDHTRRRHQEATNAALSSLSKETRTMQDVTLCPQP